MMLTKILVSAALAVSVAGMSTVAFAETVYQGGPRGMTTVRASTPAIQTNKPYAQYLPAERAGANKHLYFGGPKSPVPHAAR